MEMVCKCGVEDKVGKNDTPRNKILISMVVDASGSMEKLEKETCTMMNKFVDDQRVQTGEAILTLTFFNSKSRTPFEAISVNEMPKLDNKYYAPMGWTALLDAVGETIVKTDEAVRTHNPDQVLFIIITDGEENRSKKWTLAKVSKLIKEREEDWQFVFAGANVDEWAEAHKLGGRGLVVNSIGFAHNPAGLEEFSEKLLKSTRSYRGEGMKIKKGGYFDE